MDQRKGVVLLEVAAQLWAGGAIGGLEFRVQRALLCRSIGWRGCVGDYAGRCYKVSNRGQDRGKARPQELDDVLVVFGVCVEKNAQSRRFHIAGTSIPATLFFLQQQYLGSTNLVRIRNYTRSACCVGVWDGVYVSVTDRPCFV